MIKQQRSNGSMHRIPKDLQATLSNHEEMLAVWNDITPLARNEWICWIISPKLKETRVRRIERARSEMSEGKRRPCCWSGCTHRQ